MALGFKCDSCGKFFEPKFDPATGIMLCPNVVAIWGVDTLKDACSYSTYHMPPNFKAGNKIEEIEARNPAHFDLCPACMSSVLQFICKNYAENDEKIE